MHSVCDECCYLVHCHHRHAPHYFATSGALVPRSPSRASRSSAAFLGPARCVSCLCRSWACAAPHPWRVWGAWSWERPALGPGWWTICTTARSLQGCRGFAGSPATSNSPLACPPRCPSCASSLWLCILLCLYLQLHRLISHLVPQFH